MENNMEVPQNTKIGLPYDAAILLLGMSQRKPRTPIFPAAPFTIASTWKQQKCPSTKEWIKKMCYVSIYTMKYYSVIKKEQNCVICRDLNGPGDCHT